MNVIFAATIFLFFLPELGSVYDDTSTSVLIWWGGMTCIAMLNVCLLFITWKVLRNRLPNMSDTVQWIRKWQFALASIYVFGCGFRSILPRGDVRRIVLVDSWISAIAIGRTVATIAELCFVAQWSFILYEIGKSTRNRVTMSLSKVIVPLIVVAECFSWYACTTKNFFGTIIEESLWAVAAALTVFGFVSARPLYKEGQQRFLTGAIICGIGYFIYMATVDVPAYISKWLVDQAAGKQYTPLLEGFREVATQWTLTRAYADWQYEMVWMTLYFSVAVWGSMLIVNSPQLDKGLKEKV